MADPVRGETVRSPQRACPELVEGTVSNHIPKQSAAIRARLDALYSHLYGLSRDDAAFNRYRTIDLILAYMNSLTAGDAESMVMV